MSGEKIAFLFPGQGAQYVGMGKDFYENFPVAKRVFEEADDFLGFSFSRLIFEGPKEELTKTQNSQPAIYVVSWAIHQVARENYPDLKPYVCAGLSLGEYTALAATGKISFAEGLGLVQKRALLMQEACEIAPGSLRVVLGMDIETVQAVLADLPSGVYACIANLNCPGQIVIAGTVEGLDLAAEELKKRGGKRVLPLEVSGAFHSALMESAREKLAPFIERAVLQDTDVRLVMNTPGTFVDDLTSIRSHLIAQVTHPVYWQKGVEIMEKEGVTLFVEMGCGKTLQGMNKRIGVSSPTYSIEKIEELRGLADVVVKR